MINEFGETSGIVTFEDLIEEIVGNIYDEYDASETELIEKIKKNQWAIKGNVGLDELRAVTGIPLNSGNNYDTLNGFIYFYKNSVPKDGEKFDIQIDNYRLCIRKIKNRAISDAVIIQE